MTNTNLPTHGMETALQQGLDAFAQHGGTATAFLSAVAPSAAPTVESLIRHFHEAEGAVRAAREDGQPTTAWLGDVLDGVGPIPPTPQHLLRGLAPGVRGDGPQRTAKRLLQASVASLGIDIAAQGGDEQGGLGLPQLPTAASEATQDLIDRFLQAPIGDALDDDLVRIGTAGALQIAKSAGLTANVPAVVAMVDTGVRLCKLGYKVQTGEIAGADAAFQVLEDRIAAQFAGYVGHAVEQKLPVLGAAVGTFIEQRIPLGGQAVNVCRQLGAMAGKTLRPFVESGVRTVTKKVLKNARKVATQGIKKAVSVVASSLRALVGG